MTKLLRALALLATLAAPIAHAVTCPTFAAGDTNYIAKLNQLSAGCVATGTASSIPIVTAAGTVDAITADYTPNVTLTNLVTVAFVSTGANTSTTPSFAPDGLTAHTITARGGAALVAGDIGAAGYVGIVEYNSANTRWELLNPVKARIASDVSGLGTGVATLLGGTASGTGGPAGTASPTFTGTATANNVTVNGLLTLTPTADGVIRATSGVLNNAAQTGSGSVVLATSPTITTPTIAKLANLTTNGLVTTSGSDGTLGVTAPGTGVLTALGVNVGSAGAFVVNGGALGTPASGVATNLTGTASGLTAGTVTTNANLTGPITSSGNATSIASQTGTGTTFVMSAGPTIAGPTITGLTTHTVGATNTGVIASTGYSITGSNTTSAVSIAGTINTSGVLDVFKFAVTDTARGAGSNLFALYGGAAGATKAFTWGKDATLTGGLNALRVYHDGTNNISNYLWIMDIGDDSGANPGGSALTVGLVRRQHAGALMQNIVWDQTNKRWNVQDTAYPATYVEVGAEGVTLHTGPVGTASFTDTDSIPVFQARNTGVLGSGGPSSGYYNQFFSTLYADMTQGNNLWRSNSNPGIQIRAGASNLEVARLQAHTAAATGITFNIDKSRGTFTTAALVNASDVLGTLNFRGYDGANYLTGASIGALVDATPSSTVMPGALIFKTGTNGTPTEAMRIASDGKVGIGITPTSKFHLSGTVAGAVQGLFENLDTGTASYGGVVVRNSANSMYLIKQSTGYTTAGLRVADQGLFLNVTGQLMAANLASEDFIWARGGSATTNEVMRLAAGTLSLGVAGTTVGSLKLFNATSGSISISPITGALGTITITVPALTGTMLVGSAVNSVSPTSPNRTITVVHGGTTYYLAAKTTND